MNNIKYTCLFGGGAIRGLAYVGALRAMEELGIEYDILGGSSVGAIFAALVACGYKSYELENLFMKVNFELFKDIHLGLGKGFALSKGGIFVDWLNELIQRKFEGRKDKLKFKDFKQKLVIITTNLRTFQTLEFSNFETPDFEVADAIRVSSSMPGLMTPYNYKGAELVDGDLQKASPMWRLSNNIKSSNNRILEFRLEGNSSAGESKKPIEYINTIYSCITDVATEFVTEVYGKNDKYDCIKLSTGDIFFADFNLDKDSRRKLIDSGYKQTMFYFKQVLPKKKDKLEKVYSKMLQYLKEANKGLKANNVEEVQWWIGDLYIILAENKEIIDPTIYDEIQSLKDNLYDAMSKILFIHTKFKNRKNLEKQMLDVIQVVDERLADIRLFLQNCP